MNTLFLAAQAAQGGNSMPMILMIVVFFAIMWFFMIRPQQKRQKEIQKFQNSLTEGTPIVTGGGIHGTVKRINLENQTIDVEISRGVTVTVDKAFVYKDMNSMPMAK